LRRAFSNSLSPAAFPSAAGVDVGGADMIDWLKSLSHKPRKGMPSPRLPEEEFKRRFKQQYTDPAFEPLSAEVDKIAAAAWDAYAHSRKSPRTQQAGPGFSDPNYEIGVDWIKARGAIASAQLQHDAKDGKTRILLINGSARSEHTCPGEMSKSFRLAKLAESVFLDAGVEVSFLDLSRVASEYGRNIHPCKACFSTSPVLCHWPCTCYPNYSLGQTQDWMNEIYPLWVAAHGIMIVTPIHWYQATSPLKLMIDRLVCADGGNPDPTSTHGKDAAEAQRLELKGWDYPRHLAGRKFSIVVHGDTEGVLEARRALTDWLTSMQLESAGMPANLDRYIGYWEPYATSHDALDIDEAFQKEVQFAAETLADKVIASRMGKPSPEGGKPPREK
jgi:multimeric flavodoxin WrbA